MKVTQTSISHLPYKEARKRIRKTIQVASFRRLSRGIIFLIKLGALWFGFFGVLGFVSFFLTMITGIDVYFTEMWGDQGYFFLPLIIVVIAIFMGIGLFMISDMLLAYLERKIIRVEGLLESEEKTEAILESINSKLTSIYSLIIFFHKISLIYFYLGGPQEERKLKNYLREREKMLFEKLLTLKKSLQEIIKREKNTIKGAIEDIESLGENMLIPGGAIKKVSITRLDRQIEQFEELQKVLVKM